MWKYQIIVFDPEKKSKIKITNNLHTEQSFNDLEAILTVVVWYGHCLHFPYILSVLSLKNPSKHGTHDVTTAS